MHMTLKYIRYMLKGQLRLDRVPSKPGTRLTQALGHASLFASIR